MDFHSYGNFDPDINLHGYFASNIYSDEYPLADEYLHINVDFHSDEYSDIYIHQDVDEDSHKHVDGYKYSDGHAYADVHEYIYKY